MEKAELLGAAAEIMGLPELVPGSDRRFDPRRAAGINDSERSSRTPLN
jgi:hypothetical protein